MSQSKMTRVCPHGLILVALLAAPGCGEAETGGTGQPAADGISSADSRGDRPLVPAAVHRGHFTGSESCRQCHAEACDEFFAHPMGQSLAAMTSASQLEDDSTADRIAPEFSADGSVTRYWSVERTGEGVTHHERVATDAGEVVYDHAVPVQFAVGSGKRGRSYIVNHDGLLFMSPLSWYTQESRWDLSPGYAERNLHFGRRVIDACVSCHAGRMDSLEDAPSRFAPQPFLEPSIGCERCHGAGGEHIAFHEADDPAGTDPIINPARLSPRLRDHVCLQCHLIGEYRLLRYGRSDFDFRPGMDLTDVWTIVLKEVPGGGDAAAAAVSQAEQMLQSRCYQESAGRLGCISCHDAHTVPAAADHGTHYRTRCLNCHGGDSAGAECSELPDVREAAPFGDSCIACHMKPFAASDIPHTSQTDHRVLVSRPDAGSPDPQQAPLRFQIFGEQDGTIPVADLSRARGILLAIGAESSGDRSMAAQSVQTLSDWLRSKPDDVAVMERIGAARKVLGDPAAARDIWTRGLALRPDHEELLTALFIICDELGDYAAALEYGHRVTELNPWEHEYPERLSRIYERVGDTAAAIQWAERALSVNPADVDNHAWLADRYQSLGDIANAERHRRLYQLLSRLP